MPRISLPALETPFGQAAVTAAAAAATTYMRPARFPRWARRGLSMSSTLTSVGMALAGDRRPARSQLAAGDSVTLVDGKPQGAANLTSAVTAGMGLVTSGMALRADKTVEKMLVKRGVRHPRLVMAVGAAAISLASPWVTKAIQNSTRRLQEKAMPKETLESTLADPLGTKGADETDTKSIEPKNTATAAAQDVTASH